MDDANRIRTHLANERTFLAWFRSGLTLVALGLGVAKFLSPDKVKGLPVNTVLALLLILCGMFLCILGWTRYRRNTKEIEAGDYTPTVRAERITLLVMLAIVGTTMLLIWVSQSAS